MSKVHWTPMPDMLCTEARVGDFRLVARLDGAWFIYLEPPGEETCTTIARSSDRTCVGDLSTAQRMAEYVLTEVLAEHKRQADDK